MSIEELAVHANMIIEGDVVGEHKGEPVTTEDGTSVPRRVEVKVERTFFSDVGVQPDTIDVTDGGWQDGKEIVFDGIDQMKVGQQVVLFLTKPDTGDFFVQLAGPQGRYLVGGDAVDGAGDDPLSQSLAAKSSDALRAQLQEIGTRASTGDLVDEVETPTAR